MKTSVILKTSLRKEAVNLEAVKKFLRVDGQYEDDLISTLLDGAVQQVSERLGVSFYQHEMLVLADVTGGFDVMALPGNERGGAVIMGTSEMTPGTLEVEYTIPATADAMADKEVFLQVYNDYHHPESRTPKKRYHV